MQRKQSSERRVPDHITEEILLLFSKNSGPFDFKEIFDIILERLKVKNAAAGGEEMLRLRAYEKLQHLIQRNIVQKEGKKYRGVREAESFTQEPDQPKQPMNDRANIPANTHELRLALHAFAQKHPEIRMFLKHLSNHEDLASTDINEVARIIVRDINDLGARIISSSILQELSGLGLGTFSRGEVGSLQGISANRILWKVSTRSLGRFFLGLESEVSRLDGADSVEEDEVEEILDEDEDDDIEFSVDEDEDSEDEDSEDEDSEDEDSEDEDSEDEEWQSYIFPLREDYDIEFTIPKDLTYVEAKRMARFLMSLPFDQE